MFATDMFIKPKSLRQRLKNYCKEKGFITTIDVENFTERIRHSEGNLPGIMRLHRDIRDFCDPKEKDYCLRRLSDDEKLFRGFKKKFGTYCWIGGQNAHSKNAEGRNREDIG